MTLEILKVYYEEPSSHQPCSQCKFHRYDSFHNEQWCGHDPPPIGLRSRLLIGEWGHCDYWEKTDE